MDRAARMDHFFNSITSLMSNLLRSVVKKSLQDLIDFMLQYKEGNDYPGEYHIFRGLAVSRLKQPSTLILVRLSRYVRMYVCM